MHHTHSATVRVCITCTVLASESYNLVLTFTAFTLFHQSHLVCNIQCIIIWCQADVRLLLTVRPEHTIQKIKLPAADLEVNYSYAWTYT